ncbi:hypothetical protein VPH35_115064 [Triticum aestivum]
MSVLPSELQYIRALTLPPLTTGVLFSSTTVRPRRWRGRIALCMLLLLTLPKPSHQQPSGVDCKCYRQCYPGCKDSIPPWLCKVKCAGGCPDAQTIQELLSCLIACNTDSICDQPAPSVNVGACADDCYKMWGSGGTK